MLEVHHPAPGVLSGCTSAAGVYCLRGKQAHVGRWVRWSTLNDALCALAVLVVLDHLHTLGRVDVPDRVEAAAVRGHLLRHFPPSALHRGGAQTGVDVRCGRRRTMTDFPSRSLFQKHAGRFHRCVCRPPAAVVRLGRGSLNTFAPTPLGAGRPAARTTTRLCVRPVHRHARDLVAIVVIQRRTQEQSTTDRRGNHPFGIQSKRAGRDGITCVHEIQVSSSSRDAMRFSS